jgi:hypothetical protein
MEDLCHLWFADSSYTRNAPSSDGWIIRRRVHYSILNDAKTTCLPSFLFISTPWTHPLVVSGDRDERRLRSHVAVIAERKGCFRFVVRTHTKQVESS